jgi:hypothetical protein
MDLLHDKPVIPKSKAQTVSELPDYVSWLASGKQRPPFLQMILVETLKAQLRSDSWINSIRVWLAYPLTIAETCAEYAAHSLADTVHTWRSQMKESLLFHSAEEAQMPLHSE